MTGSRSRRLALLCGLTLTLGAVVAGCGDQTSTGDGGSGQAQVAADTRSEQAFCNTLHEHNKSMADRYHEAGDGFLAQTKLILQNTGEFRDLLADLAEHAPDEIREDAEKVSQVMGDTIDKATRQDAKPGIDGLISGLSGGIGAGMRVLMDSDSFENVDAYANEHCGLGVFSGPAKR